MNRAHRRYRLNPFRERQQERRARLDMREALRDLTTAALGPRRTTTSKESSSHANPSPRQ